MPSEPTAHVRKTGVSGVRGTENGTLAQICFVIRQLMQRVKQENDAGTCYIARTVLRDVSIPVPVVGVNVKLIKVNGRKYRIRHFGHP